VDAGRLNGTAGVFSDDLRTQTLATIAAVRELLESGQTPPPDYSKRCKACSLVEICQPELLGKRDRSVGYVAGVVLEKKEIISFLWKLKFELPYF